MFLTISIDDYNNLTNIISSLNTVVIHLRNEISLKNNQIGHLQKSNFEYLIEIQSLKTEDVKRSLVTDKKDSELKKKTENIKQLNKELTKKNILLSKMEKDWLRADVFKNKIRKSYFDVDKKQARCIEKDLKTIFDKCDNVCSDIGLSLHKVVLCGLKNQPNFEVDIKEKIENNLSIDHFLYNKDRFLISDQLYVNIRKSINPEIPSIYQIKKQRHQLNNQLGIQSIEDGFYLNPVLEIEKKIINLVIDGTITEEVVKIKLSADGTNIARNVKYINFGFSIINEGKKAAGINGQYTLGIFKVDNEDYESTKNWMSAIWNLLKNFNFLNFQERRYTIKYYFCADWKMAANVLGLYAASSNFPCLWCETHKDNLYLIDGSSKRSFKKQLEIIQKASNTKEKHFGYKTHPIISDIEHSRYLIDLLHLFLRISDVLFELFISELATLDNFSTSSTYSVMKHPILTKLICYLNENCGIKLNIFKNEKKSINSIMSNLPATNRIKVFEKLNIETLFVIELKNAPQINKIWQSFYQIYTSLKYTPSPGADVIKRSTETWLNDFLFIYHRSDVTPYIHAFTNHLHEFIQKESNVNNFNLEGLEKLNDLTTQEYFKASNKRKSTVKQILSKRSRIEKLQNTNVSI